MIASFSKREDLRLDADAGGKACKEYPTRLEHAPDLPHHALPLLLIAGKVQHGTTDHRAEAAVGKREAFDMLHAKSILRQIWRKPLGKRPHPRYRSRRGVDTIQIEAIAQKVDEVATVATACIEQRSVRSKTPLQKLIEKIDIDVAERLLKGDCRGLSVADMAHREWIRRACKRAGGSCASADVIQRHRQIAASIVSRARR